ncbi:MULTISPECIES: hypothetical protein [Halorubrum]|nr:MULTISPECIES: hypothetical protein [Halorubrum]TKX65842.1 hypothetical protein EXE40_16550 [Halorubrum sp. GN11GM_10-3_MGM]
MSSATEKVRRLAPHWAVMFVALAVVERVLGGLGLAASLLIVLGIAVAYPVAVRTLGVAPPVWQR